ncbi:hypothetical protein AB1Y20_010466 [Prymnesium parvum]|uniref:Plastid lipid-associated protein/fibrillin conserved domain-containing protein n=1 Tax=Prymnesium parvum TaxID=97485 RepID=A0AB34IRK6_PRYPA|mmetsp:Transcript_39489/g.97890  ORF Transcript_39489/g.97890 Transcript_39489/m.97890 type:complete len:224 (-) Transcript_39489:237-908(-)
MAALLSLALTPLSIVLTPRLSPVHLSYQPYLTLTRSSSRATTSCLQPWQESELAKVRLLAECEAAAGGRDTERRPGVRESIERLEQLNPTPRPLERPDLLSGCWRLVYTTSDSILGTSRPKWFRPQAQRILQSIDAKRLEAKNEEWLLAGVLKNQVKADLLPREDGRTVDVQFRRFGIGWLRIRAPASARGVLETTYLDESLRISRGDKGNLFVLMRAGRSRI